MIAEICSNYEEKMAYKAPFWETMLKAIAQEIDRTTRTTKSHVYESFDGSMIANMLIAKVEEPQLAFNICFSCKFEDGKADLLVLGDGGEWKSVRDFSVEDLVVHMVMSCGVQKVSRKDVEQWRLPVNIKNRILSKVFFT